LGALYFRLIGTSAEIYKYLEPLYNDYRKLRFMSRSGTFEIMHMDEFIDQLLRETTVCDVQLPRLQKRDILEANAQLDKRKSGLEEDLDNFSASSSEESDQDEKTKKSSSKGSREKPRSSRLSPPPTTYPRRSRTPPERRRHSSKDRHNRRSRSKSRERPSRRSPDRSGGSRSRYPDREKGKDRSSGSGKRTREDSYEREIRESNELRKKLGLAPLQQ